jgi:hypothetical protein
MRTEILQTIQIVLAWSQPVWFEMSLSVVQRKSYLTAGFLRKLVGVMLPLLVR